MKLSTFVTVAFCFQLSCVIASGEPRTWTNNKGQEIAAELITATESNVTLKVSGGQTYEISVETLSQPDQTYISEWLETESAAMNKEPQGFENWDAEWPDLISSDVSPEILEKGENEDGHFVYHSPHYEFVVNTNLSASVVKKFAVLFEATNEYMRALPLSMAKAQTEKRHRILLFESYAGYYEAGGPQGSAGVYMSRDDIIMVPLDSLGVKHTGTRWIVDYDRGNKTLPHEIAHQLTDMPYYSEGSRGWFTEGMAEYVGLTPYRSGKFNVKRVRSDMQQYVTAFGDDGRGRNIGESIRLPKFKEWALQDYGSFLQNAMVNYGAGALVFYYLAHMDGEGDGANMIAFCKALKSGKKGEEALEVLLAGRSYEQLEEEISSKWGSRGVDFYFGR